MNDRFLARGKRLEIGPRIVTTSDEWIYGYYVYGSISTYIYSTLHNPKMVSVDPKTVGSCTGLTDKNGKTIFENDIVSIIMREPWTGRLYPKLGIVKWKNGGYFVVWINSTSDDDFCKFLKGIEVVGNVHDNPELIGGAE